MTAARYQIFSIYKIFDISEKDYIYRMSKELDQELSDIIVAIVDVITAEAKEINSELVKWREINRASSSMESLAKISELKIRRTQILRIQKEAAKVCRRSTNRILISTISPD